MGVMKRFAFCLFEYVPYGGMQRDLLRIARACCRRGHRVDLFARYWRGERPGTLSVTLLPGRGITNHGRSESFSGRLMRFLAEQSYDAVVGFNKMPGLDLYFAADACFAAKARTRGPWYRLTGRCRSYLRLERAVFHPASKTEILLISEKEKPVFIDCYGTQEERFHLLPPGISRDCLPGDDAGAVRAAMRRELGVSPSRNMVLMVGSGFRTKGVDRAVRAVSSLPREILEKTRLFIVGEDRPGSFRRLARRLGVRDRVRFMGGRRDVPRFLAAADLLLHPAYRENTGTVLLEAMAAGLPVLATDICGYAGHVDRAGAGRLVPSPFRQEILDRLLLSMLTSDKKDQWKKNGTAYVSRTDVFSLPEKAADIIEQVAS